MSYSLRQQLEVSLASRYKWELSSEWEQKLPRRCMLGFAFLILSSASFSSALAKLTSCVAQRGSLAQCLSMKLVPSVPDSICKPIADRSQRQSARREALPNAKSQPLSDIVMGIVQDLPALKPSM